jgi:tRNA pseudouridine55 synthase
VTAPSGVVVVDKPAGWTSHDVVARIRVLAGTRRVGHAGTLDPMATGVLVVGVGKATRLLGYLAASVKEYLATIRLGQATDTGDAEGTVTGGASAAGLKDSQVRAAVAGLTGEIMQVPPAVSAIKIGGRRSYQLARAGAAPVLAARPVTVHSLEAGELRRAGDLLDVDVRVTCSSGTYIRALARDLGDVLGVGGHLTMLRRTRSGAFGLDSARTLGQLAASFTVIPLAEAAAAAFPVCHLTASQARALSHGSAVAISGTAPGAGPSAAFAPDGTFVALVTEQDGQARPMAVFVP